VNAEWLRILHFSTGDTTGGAAQAAFRLHVALADAGHDSRMIVRQRSSARADVTEVPPYLNPWRARGRRLARALRLPREDVPAQPPPAFNLDVTPDIRRDLFYAHAPGEIDVLVMHSITRLLTVREIRSIHDHYRAPLVWALADQAPLTGGCHYAYECDGYTARCGRCPQLESEREDDRSRVVLERRLSLLSEVPIVFVAASSGVADWVRRSAAFGSHRVEHIPAITDDRVFRPFDRDAARDLLDVPRDAAVVLLGAGNLVHARKGVLEYAVPALRRLKELTPDRNVFVLAVGDRGDELELPYPTRALGALADPLAIALGYQAADVYLCPTIADAGPLMIPESLLCGTPVVAFDVGYATDLVTDGETGYVEQSRDPADLAAGLHAVLTHPQPERMRAACRDAPARHAPARVVADHVALYRSLLAG
jgi:glycosyltransferase involved in cell wall biosynthesis